MRYRVRGDLATTWVTSTTVSISASGIRMRGRDGMEPGAFLELKISLPGIPELEIPGTIVWRSLRAPGVTEYGVEFACLTTPQQMQIDRLVAFLRRRL